MISFSSQSRIGKSAIFYGSYACAFALSIWMRSSKVQVIRGSGFVEFSTLNSSEELIRRTTMKVNNWIEEFVHGKRNGAGGES